jgi:hypothetical protein
VWLRCFGQRWAENFFVLKKLQKISLGGRLAEGGCPTGLFDHNQIHMVQAPRHIPVVWTRGLKQRPFRVFANRLVPVAPQRDILVEQLCIKVP